MSFPSDFEAPSPTGPTQVTLVTELCHGAIRYLAQPQGHFTRDPSHAFPFATAEAAEGCAAALAGDPGRASGSVTYGTVRYDLAQGAPAPMPAIELDDRLQPTG